MATGGRHASSSSSSSSTTSTTSSSLGSDEDKTFKSSRINVGSLTGGRGFPSIEIEDEGKFGGNTRLSAEEIEGILTSKNRDVKLDNPKDINKVIGIMDRRGLSKEEFKMIESHFKTSNQETFTAADGSCIKVEVIDNSIDIFKYLGFDAIQARLRVEFLEKNKETLCDDMTAVSTLVLTRGTVFNKIFKRTAREGIDIGQYLTNKYRYSKNSKKGVDNMTLSRHSHVFPDFCALVLASNKRIRILGNIPNGFPRYLCFPGSMALVDEEKKDIMLSNYIEWNLSFSKVIKSDQDKETVKRFAELSYNSPIFSNAARKIILAELIKTQTARITD